MVDEDRAAKRHKFDPHITKLFEDFVDSIFAEPEDLGVIQDDEENNNPVTILGYTPDWAYTNVFMPMRLLICIEIEDNIRGVNYDSSQFQVNLAQMTRPAYRVESKKAIYSILPQHYAAGATNFVIMWNGVVVSADKEFRYKQAE
ncbi:hypothetical protein MKW92_051803 [Papaver armeniacum]|nr:hypothetical protein MKW92_051803 [Papaver armeniacum]